MRIRITEALKHFNDNREEGVNRMYKNALGGLIDPDKPVSTMAYYLSMWDIGKELKACKIFHVQKMCDYLGVDADFLFGDVKKDETVGKKMVDTLTIHNALKYSDFTANELCDVEPMKKY